MSNLLQTGVSWLGDQLAAHAAETITYARGPVTVQISATRGKSERDSLDPAGNMIHFNRLDFLFRADALVLGAATATPRVGDEIRDSSGRIYKVSGMGDGSDPYEVDGFGTNLRVHTVQVL